jgi:hypothetical protein
LQRITEADRDDAMVLQQRKLNLGKQIKAGAAAGQVNRIMRRRRMVRGSRRWMCSDERG